MNEQKRTQIYDYLSTFWSEMRNFFTRQPEYEQYIPQIFRWTYLFITIEGHDGYVVAAYPSGFADNFLFFEKEESVENITHRLPNLVMNTDAHVVLSVDGFGGSGMYSAILDRVESDKGPVPTTGWKFLYMATPDFDWPVSEARKSAHEIIAMLKARALIYQPQDGGFLMQYNDDVMRRQLISRLNHILEQFRSIINEKSFAERVIHKFIHEHPVLLYPEKSRLIYEFPLKENKKVKYRIDFVVELPRRRYVLVELENPKHELFTGSGDFRQIVNHAENSQVGSWMLWIRRNLASVECDFPGIVAPEGLVVVGRSTKLTNEQQERIRMWNDTHDIKLKTYDELADEAENFIKHLLDV